MPALTPVTVEPLIVQTERVVEARVTGSPEVAVALAVVVPPTTTVAGEKESVFIDWEPLPTVMFCVICCAELTFPLPAWLAAIVHVPTVTGVTVVPLIEQMVGVVELKVTGRLEEAVALAAVVPPTARAAGLKVIAPIV